MMYRPLLVVTLLSLCITTTAYGAVVINEIAWMGTAEDTTNEWIELYNSSSESVVLDGWSVVADDGAPSIQLSGTIAGNSYFLIERTDDSTLPEVSADLVASFGTGLGNGGERLRLLDAGSTEIDEVNGLDGWTIAGVTSGNNETKETAQRSGNSWFTGTPTPRRANSAQSTVEVDETVSSGQSSSQRSSGSSSRVAPKASVQKERVIEKPELTLSIQGPKTVYVNQSVTFEAVPEGVGKTTSNSLKYTWNFGDTYTGTGQKTGHTFKHEGEYIIFLEGTFGKQYASVRQEVRVLPVTLTLTETHGGHIRVENTAPYEVDIGGFTITGTRTFTFPKFTILKSKGALIVDRIRIGNSQVVSLYDHAKVLVASAGQVRPFGYTETIPVPIAEEMVPRVVSDTVPETPSQTVIQIGSPRVESDENRSILARFVGGMARLFGF